jgi:hypothetical protein
MIRRITRGFFYKKWRLTDDEIIHFTKGQETLIYNKEEIEIRIKIPTSSKNSKKFNDKRIV